jgi:hypothetical protein
VIVILFERRVIYIALLRLFEGIAYVLLKRSSPTIYTR